MPISQLAEYISQVISARARLAAYLLPNSEEVPEGLDSLPAECLLDFNVISECMKDAGKDIRRLIPLQVTENFQHSINRWTDWNSSDRDHILAISDIHGRIRRCTTLRLPLTSATST